MYRQIQGIVQEYPNTLLLNYADGVQNMVEQLIHHLHLNPDAATLKQIAERLQYHSKRKSEVFQEESTKTGLASASCQQAYERLSIYRT